MEFKMLCARMKASLFGEKVCYYFDSIRDATSAEMVWPQDQRRTLDMLDTMPARERMAVVVMWERKILPRVWQPDAFRYAPGHLKMPQSWKFVQKQPCLKRMQDGQRCGRRQDHCLGHKNWHLNNDVIAIIFEFVGECEYDNRLMRVLHRWRRWREISDEEMLDQLTEDEYGKVTLDLPQYVEPCD